MKSKIFSFVKVTPTSMVASVRIARYLAEYLKLDIVIDDSVADEPLDTLYIVNGAYAFSKSLEALGRAIEQAGRVVWVQNDYTIIPPKPESDAQSPFRKAFRTRRDAGKPDTDFWTTCEEFAQKTARSAYINWNALTFDTGASLDKIAARRATATDDLLYYGSFRHVSGRTSRLVYFDRYFTMPAVETTISSPSAKFSKRYVDPKLTVVGAYRENFFDQIGSHGLGLYIEDRMSHDEFHSPANRFYEMLSAGLPMVFAPECRTQLAKAGYEIDEYVVRGASDVAPMMIDKRDIGAAQWHAWASGVDHAGKLRSQIDIASRL